MIQFQKEFVKLGIFILFIFIIVFIKENNKKPEPKQKDLLPKMSIYNQGSSGLKAFRTLLEKQGYTIIPITEELPLIINEKKLQHLCAGKYSGNSVLIIAADLIDERLYQRIQKIASFGFSVLILTDNKESLETLLDENDTIITKESSGIDRVAITHDTNKLFENTEYFVSTSNVRITSHNTIVSDKTGGIITAKTVGTGKIIICVTTDVIQNQNIGKFDNMHAGYLTTQFFSDGLNVYFYEYIHGVKKKYTLFYLFSNIHYRPFVISLLLLITGFILSGYLRFGIIEKTKNTTPEIRYLSSGLGNIIAKKKFTGDIKNSIILSANRILNIKKTDEISNKELDLITLQKKLKDEINRRL
ncbi:MAG: hypothetical protein A2015_16500 [Spirochaetes bacterium GWF1_31_7]|nr:MAG: hypothetical protein A2Y30_13865 [Spirochaetes bacterium GWE1_32_154]OHD50045.1 MAG: hypothetical protein A2Y29_11910 [Spirochaetes bacterium GWE2_31_10]OHD52359.1 MAG: hypothetical protein A2015_16500 [Spirochaetes bacterium GWF1_31_7]OHD83157.1 MAG: hypothetical protein A2355_09965 [Spirochaetes bacterium RIFOXYB1_FULL_32_8]HBD95999.1 hypothetical protein [Spirochaetia bacterium]